MISNEEIEELLPCPIKIEICCDRDDFKTAVQGMFKDLLMQHNKNYETKIEYIARHYIYDFEDEYEDESEDFFNLKENDCRIFVGKEVVQYIKGPDVNTSVSLDESFQKISDYYRSIVPITEQILNTWHDKIIEVQEENSKKIENYKFDGYDELLYGYYSMRSDARAFQYLKKLATRYPNSKYMNRLRRSYLNGLYGHKRKMNLANKISKRQSNENWDNF